MTETFQHSTQAPIVGILAGGQGSRMGGVDKAALPAPDDDGPLLFRTVGLVQALGLSCVLVGARKSLQAQRPDLVYLEDSPQGVGPLGGLHAVVQHAEARPCLLLACDMPYLEKALIAKLASTTTAAPIVAPREPASRMWQPFFARYDSPVVANALHKALAEGTRSFQRLFATLTVEELRLEAQERECIADWDTPEDMHRPHPNSRSGGLS